MIYRNMMLFGIVLLLLAALRYGPPRLVYNTSASAPIGWYWITHANALRVGDYVLADLPAAAAELAAERRYLPRGVPILKQISATFGQRVCVQKGIVRIDDQPQATALLNDAQHRRLPVWSHCRVLTVDEFFLLNPQREASFDSRYFGPIERSAVLGYAQPLWTWSVH